MTSSRDVVSLTTAGLSPETVQASYDFCDRWSREAGSSFCLAFLLLPGAKRRAMSALYAFMRHTDDLADNPQPAQLRSEALTVWRAALEHALLGRFERRADSPPKPDTPDPVQKRLGLAILPALADTVERFQIPPEHLRAAIDGAEMDLRKQRYETFAELQQYCQLVASTVGLACVHVWGFRSNEAFGPARQCGIALQLTNILRDLREDAENDRIYLPLEDLRRCDYSADELIRGKADERFDRLVAMEVARAKECYGEGAELMHWLEPDGRRIFGMMMSTYRALLTRIEQRPREVLARRVRLGRSQKLRIAARWALLPPRMAALQ